MIERAIVAVVEACRRHALLTVAVAALAVALSAYLAATRLGINTDTNDLISKDLPWRQREAEFDRLFPQNVDLIAVVIDGKTADRADGAAAALAERLTQDPALFRSVRRPDGGAFFEHNGLLFLSLAEVQHVADQLIAAQPLLGTLAPDPSLRGLAEALRLALQGVAAGELESGSLDRPLAAIADAIAGALEGTPRPVDWQMLLTGRSPKPLELRRFIVVQPVLDYSALQPGSGASDAIRRAARELGLTPERGVRVRLTGSVPLSDEEFATVAQGAGGATLLSFALVCVILFLALRSARLIAAILLTLAAGLAMTAGFAAAAVGELNLISVAFAVLFVGIAVDFGIQFSVRYRDQRHRLGELAAALRGAASSIGSSLLLAAMATAVGFYSFVPTDYKGVSELGIIAGTSMAIAFVLNVTLLPALLALLRPAGETHPIGYAWAAGADRFLDRRRRLVLLLAAALAGLGVGLAPKLTFDFNPLNLKDPHTESVSTLFDLMADPSTTPYTLNTLVASAADADALAHRLERLPQVAQTATIKSYVPEQQDEKLAIIGDLALLVGPTLSPPTSLPPPSDVETIEALKALAASLRKDSANNPTASRLADLLDAVVRRGPVLAQSLADDVISGLTRRLAQLRNALEPERVTLETLPDELRREWIAADGRARVEIFPAGDTSDNRTLAAFVAAVETVTTEITGTPIAIQESGRTVVSAFVRAGIIALVAITALLLLVLRRARDTGLVLAPLLLAGLLTVSTCVLADLPLNFANIIALPLLLGIGVSFDIYFVMNWRAGLHAPLQSSTARAVLFSALTTVTAFGSLALSSHPGTSEMGKLLTIALGYTLLCTLFVLPALLGPARPARPA